MLGGQKKFWGNSYVYDAWGNLLQKNVTKCSAENLSIMVLANNRIGTSGYAYDASGNMTSDGTDGVTAVYDAENRIATATKSGVTTTYTYDADGNRVKKIAGSTGTLYWYMTPGIVAESDQTGTLKSEYVFFGGQRVARRDLVAPTGVFYYFSDHLKTASVVTDAAGVIKAESDYYPWGGELQFVANDSNHYKFTGKERDLESGLDYFGARYYSNGLGRFISADWSATPIPVPYADFGDPQSLNQYSYVRNIPTVRVDADGHDGCCTLSDIARLVDEGYEAGKAMIDALKPAAPAAPVAGSALAAAGPAALLALPSAGAMTLVVVGPKFEVPEGCAGDCSSFYIPAPQAQGQSQQGQAQNQGQTQETEHEPEPQVSTSGAGARKGGGGASPSERDPKRRFTPAESKELKSRAQGNCDTCHKKTVRSTPYTKGSKHSPREGQAGHKKASSKGGKTELSNGKWQCKRCNQSEGANSK
ncbi:MAG: hypothetical protein LAO20_02705 [Acidobacteriia bacterium]|nr:hypothetical protein [Terriglobia bacterium]